MEALFRLETMSGVCGLGILMIQLMKLRLVKATTNQKLKKRHKINAFLADAADDDDVIDYDNDDPEDDDVIDYDDQDDAPEDHAGIDYHHDDSEDDDFHDDLDEHAAAEDHDEADDDDDDL